LNFAILLQKKRKNHEHIPRTGQGDAAADRKRKIVMLVYL